MSNKQKVKNLCPIFESQRQVTFESTEALVNDRKFDTAIRLSQVTNFKRRLNESRVTQDDQILLDFAKRHNIHQDDIVIDHAVYSRWLISILTSNENPRRWNKQDCSNVDKIWELVKDNIIIQTGYMTSSSALPDHEILKSQLMSALSSVAPDDTIKKLVITATKLGVMVERIGLIQGVRRTNKSDEEYRLECSKINNWKDESLQLNIGWSNRLCLIQMINGNVYIMPRVYLLLFHNKVCDLISVLLCSKVGQLSSMDDNSYTSALSLVKEMCKLNIKYQLKFYTIMKSLESLVTAETLRTVDLGQ